MMSVIYVMLVLGYVFEHWTPNGIFFIGGLVTLVGFVNQFNNTFYEIAGQYIQLIQYQNDCKSVDIINQSYREQEQILKRKITDSNWELIKIQNLNFAYHSDDKENLLKYGIHNLTIEIVRKQRVAIIGESGSGKSTLLSLLQGLYIPEIGVDVKVDGYSKNMSFVNDNVTLFPQESEIFENTLLYNITFGLPFPEDMIHNACKVAELEDLLSTLPKGINSNISQKGANFSVGQKQRIALARGILSSYSSSIVLLDEPTSNIDYKTESKIFANLFQSLAEKTIFFVVHRLHFLDCFDYIYVMKNGSIADHGTFDLLLNKSSVFKDLWDHQKVGA